MHKKILSLAVGVAFLFSQTAPLCAENVVRSPEAKGELELPEALGKIVFRSSHPSKKTVYYIQDAHLNLKAQESIAGLLEHLREHAGLELVGLEGAQGIFDLSRLKRLPFPEIKEKIWNGLLRSGKVSGAEYYAYLRSDGLQFVGVDDGGLYLENLKAYVGTLKSREKALERLSALSTNLRNLQNTIVRKELRQFSERLRDLKDAQGDYAGYFRFLTEEAKSRGLAMDGYPLLRKALETKELSSVDPEEWMREISELETALRKGLYQSPEEERLDSWEERLALLRLFYALELTPEEFYRYQKDRGAYQAGSIEKELRSLSEKARINFVLPDADDSVWKGSLKGLEEFYKLAKDRDGALARNLVSALEITRSSTACLVAGGFHSAGIREALQKAGVNLIVIQPQVALDFKGPALYRTTLASYEPLFAAQGILANTVSPLSNLKPLVAPNFNNRDQVDGFWRDEVFTPYIQEVKVRNRAPGYQLSVAGAHVVGEVGVPSFLGALFDSGFDLRSLNRSLGKEPGLFRIDDEAFQEAADSVKASSLGSPGAVKMALIYLTDHVHEGKIYEPLGLETLAGYLEKVFAQDPDGIKTDVTLYHGQIEGSVEEIIRKIKKDKPQIVGLSLWFGTLQMAKVIYTALDALPPEERPLIVMGNTLATYNEEKLLAKEYFPRAILNIKEGELSLAGIVRHVSNPEKYPLKNVPNLLYRPTDLRGTKVVTKKSSTRLQVPDLSQAPSKDLGLMKTSVQMLDLTTLGIPSRRFTDECIAQGNNVNMEASRGCMSHCSYCSEANTGVRVRPLDQVIAEIEDLSRRGALKINIVDDVFLGGRLDLMRQFAARISQLKQEGKINKDMRFYTTARARDIWDPKDDKDDPKKNEERRLVYKELVLAGFMTFNIGIESGSDSQLRRYGKGIPVSVNEKAVQVLKEIGAEVNLPIEAEAGFIPFDPETTLDELDQNIAFLERTGLKESISYPFQQMRIQAGTGFVLMADRSGLLHKGESSYDPDWLVYDYHYRHPEVARVLYHIKRWEPSVFRFFYAIKQLMRAMPVKGSTPEEHSLLSDYYRDIHRIQVELMKGMIAAEKRPDPEGARTDSIAQMNDRLRRFYFSFLNQIRDRKLWTDKDIFKRLIYLSLIKNTLTYSGLYKSGTPVGWDQGKPFGVLDLTERLQPPKDMGIMIDPNDHLISIITALSTLLAENELQGESGYYRVTGDFYAMKEMQKVDLPKGAKPEGVFEYRPSYGRSINVVLAGPPLSGRETAARSIEKKYNIPRISMKELIDTAFKQDPRLAEREDYRDAREGKRRYPYSFIRKLVWKKLSTMDLGHGFVMEAGLYLDQLDLDVFRRLGIDIDYVLFMEPDAEIREGYMKQLPSDERPAVARRITEHQKDMPDLYKYFYQKGKAIRVPLDKLHPDEALAVFDALNSSFSYILRESDIPAETLLGVPLGETRRLSVLRHLMEETHAGAQKAFEEFKSYFASGDATKTLINNPGKHPNGRISDQLLRIIMIQANKAGSPEEKRNWVKFLFSVEPVRNALKNGWLPGFALFFLNIGDDPEALKILRAHMTADWPFSPDAFFEVPEDFHPRTLPRFLMGASYHQSVISQLTHHPESLSMRLDEFTPATAKKLLNEGVMMFKPGVQMTEQAMVEVLDRLNYFGYEVVTMKRVDGPEMKKSHIIHEQYGVTSDLAREGSRKFTEQDHKSLYRTYDKPGFEDHFHFAARALPIFGAYELIERFGLEPTEVTALWSVGYDKETSKKKIRKPKPSLENPPRILIIDDDLVLLDLLSENIRSMGFEAVTVKSGEEAMVKTKEQSFDMIFSDINLPGTTGDEFAAKFLDSAHPQIPIVLMSSDRGLADFPSVKFLLETEDKVEFIAKPFGQEDVVRLVRKYMPAVPIGTSKLSEILVSTSGSEDEKHMLKALLKEGHTPIFDRGYINGINKIGDRLYVLPTSDPKVNDGRPFFLVNGHFIHVSEMYESPEAKTYIFITRALEQTEYKLPNTEGEIPTNVSWRRIRTELLGITDPQAAQPGTIRNDLFTGVLPVTKGLISTKNNGVHYSESALEALKEIRLWFPNEIRLYDTTLGRLLAEKGYTDAEIQYFLTDPLVKIEDKIRPLFTWVSVMDLDETAEFLLSYLPPYYGSDLNPDLPKGKELPTVSYREYLDLIVAYNERRLGLKQNLVAGADLSPIRPEDEVNLVTDLTAGAPLDRQKDYLNGVKLLEKGRVARVVSAAGNAGRFLGYDKPERERVRALAPLLEIRGPFGGVVSQKNAFQVEGLLHETVQTRLKARLPLWIMTNDLSDELIRDSFQRDQELATLGREANFYRSLGIPRFNPNREDLAALGAKESDIKRWIEENGGEGGLFKWAPGEISRKTPGHLDVVASLVLNGGLKEMIKKGVDYLDVADASNLGTLPDPELYGRAVQIMEGESDIGMVPVLASRNLIYEGVIPPRYTGGTSLKFSVLTRNGSVIDTSLPEGWSVNIGLQGRLVFLKGGVSVENPATPILYKMKPETGGGFLSYQGQPQIVESLRIPSDFNQSVIKDFFTFRAILKVDALLGFYGMDRAAYMKMTHVEIERQVAEAHKQLPLYVEIKEVPHDLTGERRRAAQVVRNFGDLAPHLGARYIRIDRDGIKTLSGYVGYKTQEDVPLNQSSAKRIFNRLFELSPERHPFVQKADLEEGTTGQSLGSQSQTKLRDLVLEGKSRVHSILVVPDEAGLKDLNEELLRSLLRNPNNHLSLYLSEDLMEKVPEKWQRKNLHLVNAGKVPIRQYLDQSKNVYSSTALIASEGILQGQDLKGFSGYRLVSDRLKDKEGVSNNRSGRSVANFLAGVSFGLLVQGDLYRSHHLTDELLYEAGTKTYYVNKSFALGRLLEEWMGIFQGLLAIKKAA